MNRVLEYSARHGRRGSAYGTASMMLAGVVLAAPALLFAVNELFQFLVLRPRGWVPEVPLRNAIMDGPALLILVLPVIGLVLGTIGLSLRCKRDTLVLLGVLVNIAGLIAAAALWIKG